MSSLTDYVINHYSRLMTDHEREVVKLLTMLYKRDEKKPGPGIARQPTSMSDLMPDQPRDPEVITDAQAGWEQAREQIATRILRDHADEVYINRCPECQGVTNTPTARMCPHCPHTWFHIPRDQRL
jgi:hypothetical protein